MTFAVIPYLRYTHRRYSVTTPSAVMVSWRACNGVQIVYGRVDECGNRDGNIVIDGGNVRSVGQDAGLFQQFRMVVVSTLCQEASASCIASSWLIL